MYQKTLEVSKYILEENRTDILAKKCNIWIPRILPLKSYAPTFVRSILIEVYETYLVQLPSTTLHVIVKPLLSSLFPGIYDERSKFLPFQMPKLQKDCIIN